jgi:hypothetical protein
MPAGNETGKRDCGLIFSCVRLRGRRVSKKNGVGQVKGKKTREIFWRENKIKNKKKHFLFFFIFFIFFFFGGGEKSRGKWKFKTTAVSQLASKKKVLSCLYLSAFYFSVHYKCHVQFSLYLH